MLKRLSYIAIVMAAYFVGGRLGLAVPFTSGNVSPVWPPSGIALAAMLVLGYGVWPGVAVGALLVNFLSPMPHAAAFGIAVGNTLGPLASAWMLRRLFGFSPVLSRLRDVFALVVVGALGGTAISATIGTLVLRAGQVAAWSNGASAWLIWWLGDGMGVLIVAPLLLTLPALRATRGRRLLELAALVAGAVAVCAVVFGTRRGVSHEILALAVVPFVMWGAIRFETAGAAAISFFMAALAVWDTAHGLGPFVDGTPLRNATLMESFLAVIAVSGLSVAALVTERTRLIRDAQRRGEQTILLLSRAVEQTADSVIVTDRRGIIEYVNPAFEATTGYPRDEAIGRTPAILKSGHHDQAFYRALWDRILAGQPFRDTLVNRKRNGELYWAEQTITPITDDARHITHFVSVLKDVTELRKRQEQEVHLRLARQVQQAFYRAPRDLPGLDIAAASYPAAETGGDYFDFIPASDDAMYLAIGDASGHGFSAALVMALTRAYVRSFAALDLDVSEILTRINRMLVSDLEDNRFVTLLLARIDARRRVLSYANAGHVPGYVLCYGGAVHCVIESTGPPMGVFVDSTFPQYEIHLEKNQTVLLVTDGVTETDDSEDEQFGSERLIQYAVARRDWTARQMTAGIFEAARAFAGDRVQSDDITSVVVRVL